MVETVTPNLLDIVVHNLVLLTLFQLALIIFFFFISFLINTIPLLLSAGISLSFDLTPVCRAAP